MVIAAKEYARYGLDASNARIPAMLDALEHRIRSFTRNRFQVRRARFEAASKGGVLLGVSPLIGAGDTVQVTYSDANDGLYVVEAVEGSVTRLDRPLLDGCANRVTLVRYPEDVKAGVAGMVEYELSMPKQKAAIASETLSRHSVSYRAVGAADGFAGYPQEVTAFLKPYMRACF